jgi:hypothetical protein
MSRRLLVRPATVWLVLIAVETVHGILRGMLLVPLVGDLLALPLALVGLGVLLVLVAYFNTTGRLK